MIVDNESKFDSDSVWGYMIVVALVQNEGVRNIVRPPCPTSSRKDSSKQLWMWAKGPWSSAEVVGPLNASSDQKNCGCPTSQQNNCRNLHLTVDRIVHCFPKASSLTTRPRRSFKAVVVKKIYSWNFTPRAIRKKLFPSPLKLTSLSHWLTFCGWKAFYWDYIARK